MRKLFLACIAVLATLCLTAPAAFAQWSTNVEEDLFSGGNTAVMLGFISINSGIYARCTTTTVSLAYIEAAGDASKIESPVEAGQIVFKADTGTRFSSKASIYRHNDGYIGFSFDDADKIVDVIRDIGAARSKIAVGLDLVMSDEPMSVSVSARGSSRAAKQFLEACGLDG